jgi:uncharacterized protein (TIGR03435 family)
LRLGFVRVSEEVRDLTRAFVRSRWIAASALACATALGQATTAPLVPASKAPPPAFDAADIRANPPTVTMFTFSRNSYRAGKYLARNSTMVDLIRAAYRLDADKILGGPPWLESDRFDVQAKTSPSISFETAMLMLRTLLEDRFKLQVHDDTRPLPAYTLRLGKRKLQLKEPDRSAPAGCRPQPFKPPPPGGAMPPQTVDCHNVTMGSFAEQVRRMANGYLDKPVVDKTGIEGNWDLTISWTARGQLGLAGSEGVSVFEALERIGLKLEPDTLPTPVIVVDRVNRTPTPNVSDIAKILGEKPPPTEFDVADVKPANPDSRNQMLQNMPGGRLDIKGMNLKFLIQVAWDITPDLIVGGPKWIDSDRFDIVAKAPESDPPEPFVDFDTMRLMLRSLLVERFKLATHTETQPGNVYALTAPKRPLKMKQAPEEARTFCKQSPGAILGNPALTNSFTCQNATMADFAKMLRQVAGGYIDHPVIDSTELSGGWDFVLSWTGRGVFDRVSREGGRSAPSAAPNVPNASDPNGAVSAFEAVEKLGLKLERQKHPTEVLVIDHVEPPTDN